MTTKDDIRRRAFVNCAIEPNQELNYIVIRAIDETLAAVEKAVRDMSFYDSRDWGMIIAKLKEMRK